MKNELIEKQKRALLAHMKDYQNASQLSKKSQAIIFDKHKLPNGEFGSGLRDELREARISFAKEWGINGSRNEHFVKKLVEEAQRPSESQVEDMHRKYLDSQQDIERGDAQVDDSARPENKSRTVTGAEFLKQLSENAQRHKKKHTPGMG